MKETEVSGLVESESNELELSKELLKSVVRFISEYIYTYQGDVTRCDPKRRKR